MGQVIQSGAARRTSFEPASWAWQDRAACRSQPSPFFGAGELEIAEARSICGRCTVRMSCLAFALEHGERFGIWGGATERERDRMSEHERRSAARAAEREAEAAAGVRRVILGL